jgi:hypothetical protein
MKNSIFLAILLLLTGAALTAAAKSKVLKSKVNPDEVTSLQFFEPIAFIRHIETGNEAVFNDSMSAISRQILSKLLVGYRQELHLSGTITLPDTGIRRKVILELVSVINRVVRYGNLYCVKPTPVIDSVLSSRGSRFGLCTVSLGFTRVKGNYGKEFAKSKALGILMNGWDYENPVPFNSSVFEIIFDAREHEVAFFGISGKPENPLNEESLQKRFREAFKGYFDLR